MSAQGTAATGQVEHMLRQVTPGRFDAYEALLRALADPAGGRVWMLLWHGQPGSPDARYGAMEVEGLGYVPCVTSAQELAVSGWSRAHEVAPAVEVARSLYPERLGIWLNPHAPGGGVGIPWPDLRRIATGLDRMPAGPLRLSEPAVEIPQFYALLTQHAHRTPAVRSLRRAWVQPSVGVAYLAVGLDLYDGSPASVDAARAMMRQAVAAVPEGLPVSTVALSDDYDPVALWMRAASRPFYDRDAHIGAPAAPGYGYPQPGSAPH
ncbi:enhanced serine sensitivity protein SseB C-terminal domain-containing protein [Streptomyces sp. C10-9-1]|uniref:enhanced serine sensitivity protein SseB C-terminal domain-containing protein n=1 Tax=Streptomyces sp. C10-9-1 TaxID=1859285 RepID=UPI003D7598B2